MRRRPGPVRYVIIAFSHSSVPSACGSWYIPHHSWNFSVAKSWLGVLRSGMWILSVRSGNSQWTPSSLSASWGTMYALTSGTSPW